MKKKNIKRIWCFDCMSKRPPTIRKSEFLVPLRVGYYDLTPCGADIDGRVIGICVECLADKNKFQRENATAIDLDHKQLVYRSV